MAVTQKVKTVLLRASGYLIPLVQQIPPLGVYGALMTVPVIVYLSLLFSQLPMSILEALFAFFMLSFISVGALITTLVIVGGLALVLYSALYLRLHKKDGLVTSGPYRYIRHPQYTGFLLFTIGLTGWSFWILSVTFGIGWLTREATIGLWFLELGAYLVLALIEESYLLKEFGEGYTLYKNEVPFLLPFGKTSRYDIPLSILLLSLLCFGIIQIQFIGTPFF